MPHSLKVTTSRYFIMYASLRKWTVSWDSESHGLAMEILIYNRTCDNFIKFMWTTYTHNSRVSVFVVFVYKLVTKCWKNLSSLRSKRFKQAKDLGRGFSVLTGREMKREPKNERRERGRGRKETLADKPLDFENLRSPANAAPDWLG